jgi:hypothetical protein
MVRPGPQRRHRRLTYVATGESAVAAELLDHEAPALCRQVWDLLPVADRMSRGQFSGAEVFILLDNPRPATPENQVQIPLPGKILPCPEGAPTHASLVARIPGDRKYDRHDFARACRRVRREGPHRLTSSGSHSAGRGV